MIEHNQEFSILEKRSHFHSANNLNLKKNMITSSLFHFSHSSELFDIMKWHFSISLLQNSYFCHQSSLHLKCFFLIFLHPNSFCIVQLHVSNSKMLRICRKRTQKLFFERFGCFQILRMFTLSKKRYWRILYCNYIQSKLL